MLREKLLSAEKLRSWEIRALTTTLFFLMCGYLYFDSTVTAKKNDEFKTISSSARPEKLNTCLDTAQKVHCRNTSCAQEELARTRGEIYLDFHLHGHDDKRCPTEVTSNEHFRGTTEVTSNTHFRASGTGWRTVNNPDCPHVTAAEMSTKERLETLWVRVFYDWWALSDGTRSLAILSTLTWIPPPPRTQDTR